MSSKPKEKKNIVKTKIKNPVKKPATKITVDSKTLVPFIDAILTCQTEVPVTISEKSLHVQQVDGANILMIIADCECTADIPEDGVKKFGIDLELLKKTLIHSKDCRVTLTVDGEKLMVEYGRFSAKISLSDTSFLRKEPNMPKIALDTEFEIPGKYLYDATRMVSGNGKCYIFCKNGVVFVAAEEGDLCVREVVGTCDKDSQARSLYSNDYLRDIAKIVKAAEIKVKVAIDHPVWITAEQNGCKFEFILAPRIEAD